MNESLKQAVLNLEAIAVGLGNYQVPESGETCEEYIQRLQYVSEFLNEYLLGGD